MKFSNIKTLYKILLCFAVVTLFIGGTTWFATSQMRRIAEIAAHIGKLAPDYGPRFAQVLKGYERMIEDDYVAIRQAKLAKEHDEARLLASSLTPRTTALRRQAQTIAEALEKHVMELITTSNSQVKNGVELVNRAGESLKEIVASIESVATIVSDIASASASAEQAGGIDQVNKALSQMDEVTQQNSALVEQNAATAKNLQQQSATMSRSVGVFRLGDGAREAPVKSSTAVLATSPFSSLAHGARRIQAGRAAAVKAAPEWAEF